VPRFLAALVSLLAATGLVRLYAPPRGPEAPLAFTRAELGAGAGQDAQASFPEGYFFLHCLYGPARVEAGRDGHDRAQALREARWALARLDGPEGTAPFSPQVAPRYGETVARRVAAARGRLDPATGLLPHATGRPALVHCGRYRSPRCSCSPASCPGCGGASPSGASSVATARAKAAWSTVSSQSVCTTRPW
jgi:hypothetical protein